MSTAGAPPYPGCCSTAVAVGANHILVIYDRGARVKTYRIETDTWRDEVPPTRLGRIIVAGELAIDVSESATVIYDSRHARWDSLPPPPLAWTRVIVDGQRVIAARHDGRFGITLGGAAVLDLETRRWHAIPDGADAPRPRDAPWRFVGNTLVVLPGQGECPSTCAHPDHPDATVEPIEPGAMWTLGTSTWRPLAPGPVGVRTSDVAVVVDDELIALSWLGRGFVSDSGGLRTIAADTGWWRLSVADNQWSRITQGVEPLRSSSDRIGTAYVSGHHALVLGGRTPALYDSTRGVWEPAPPQLAKSPDYVVQTDDGRVIALDGQRRPQYIFDLTTRTGASPDIRSFPTVRNDGQAFAVSLWTGRCFVWWGETSWTVSNACENRPQDMGCDPPPTPTTKRATGRVWCVPPAIR